MARRRGTEREWRERLERWDGFTGTVAAFSESVSSKAFYVWRKRLRGGQAKQDVDFVEVTRPSFDAVVEVVAPSGTVVRLLGAFDAGVLRSVVAVVAEHG